MYKMSFAYDLLIYSFFLCWETTFMIGVSVISKHQRNCSPVNCYFLNQLHYIQLNKLFKERIDILKGNKKATFYSGKGIKMQSIIFIFP